MYDPVYLVEAGETPMAVIAVGELEAWMDEVGKPIYSRCTVWFTDETGQMVSVYRAQA